MNLSAITPEELKKMPNAKAREPLAETKTYDPRWVVIQYGSPTRSVASRVDFSSEPKIRIREGQFVQLYEPRKYKWREPGQVVKIEWREDWEWMLNRDTSFHNPALGVDQSGRQTPNRPIFAVYDHPPTTDEIVGRETDFTASVLEALQGQGLSAEEIAKAIAKLAKADSDTPASTEEPVPDNSDAGFVTEETTRPKAKRAGRKPRQTDST